MTSVADILKQSDSIGGELTKLLTNPGDTSRKDIQTKLDQFVAKSEQLETKAKALEAPKDLLDQNVHQFFVLAMTFRHTGLADLKPSLMNALEVQDTDVAAEQISQRPLLPDQLRLPLQGGLRPQGHGDRQGEEPRPGSPCPAPQFLTDPDLASTSQAQEIIAAAQEHRQSPGRARRGHRQGRGQPDEQEIKSGQTYNLTSSDAARLPGDGREPGEHGREGRPGGGHPGARRAASRRRSP